MLLQIEKNIILDIQPLTCIEIISKFKVQVSLKEYAVRLLYQIGVGFKLH